MKSSLLAIVLALAQLACESAVHAASRPSESLRRRRLAEDLETSGGEAGDYSVQMAQKRKGKGRKSSDDEGGGSGSGGKGAGGGKGVGGKGGGGKGGGGDRAGKWKQNYELLQKYRATRGTAAVPLEFEDGDVKLGRWLRAIQKAWRDGKLPAEKVDQLKALGVASQPAAGPGGGSKGGGGGGSKGGGSGGSFQEFAAALAAYKRSNGHLAVPRSFVAGGEATVAGAEGAAGGLKLGAWLAAHLAKAHRGSLDEARHAALRQLFAQLGGDFDAASEKAAASGSSEKSGAGGGGGAKGGKGAKGARKAPAVAVADPGYVPKSDD